MSKVPEHDLAKERHELIKKSFRFLEPKMTSIRVYDTELRDFSRWLDRPENLELKKAKIKRTTINPIYRKFKSWNEQLDAGQSVDAHIKQINGYREKFPAFAEASKKYVAFRKAEEKRLKAEVEEKKERLPFADLKVSERWYFYYIYPLEYKSILTIARCLLTTYKKVGGTEEEITVSLENVRGSDDLLLGCFEKIEGSKVRYYNLMNNGRTRHLHFKVCKIEEHHNVLVGAYTTFDNKELYSGSLVLQRVKEGTTTEDMTPLEANKFDEIGNYKHIPPFVQKYLGPRFENHNLVPSGIGSKEGVEKWLKDRPKFEVLDRMGRFFDSEISKLFIAYPQTSYYDDDSKYLSDKNTIEQISKELKNELGALNVEIVTRDKSKIIAKRPSSFMSLMELKTVKHFVLITGKHDSASFSSVMLGWAMSNCMNVLIIYERGTVSERYLALEKLRINTQGIQSIQEDTLLIKEAILSFVKDATFD